MVVPSPLPRGKAHLREELRARRHAYAASLAPETRAALEADLAEVLAPVLLKARAVAGYHPLKDEISPGPALEAAAASGKITAVPAFVDRDARMTFRSGDVIDPGPWGILQPRPDAPNVAPDLLLVPLIAIDRVGNRIGMGKGHYDRVLPGLRASGATLVGVGWDCQLLDQPLEPEPWDVPLDAFASPAGLEDFRR